MTEDIEMIIDYIFETQEKEMKYKVIKDRQESDFMVGTIGDYKFWLNWVNENTINSSALQEDIDELLEYYKTLSERELIKFIDDTYEITIVESEDEII